MMEKIEHKAVVTDIKENNIALRINNEGLNCSACAISAFCNLKKMPEITLCVERAENMKIGDEITLKIDENMEKKGIFFLYALPSFIFITTVFGFKFFDFSDTSTILLSVCVLCVYFFMLYLFKNRFNKGIKIMRESK